MKLLLLIIIGLLLGIAISIAMIAHWLRDVQEKHDIMLASVQSELVTRENRLLIIAQRLERVFKLRNVK